MRCSIFLWAMVFFFLPISYAVGSSDADVAALVTNPPRVARLVARRWLGDGTEVFILMKYDNGNMFMKSSRTRATLDKKLLVKGDHVCGRIGNQVWMCEEQLGGNLWVADIHVPPTTNSAVLQHQRVTLQVADHNSRLGRSILTFGINVPLLAEVHTTNGFICFQDGDASVTAAVELKSPTPAGLIPFCSNVRRVRPGVSSGKLTNVADVVYEYECSGELSPQTKIPIWFDIVEYGRSGRKRQTGRVEILDVQLSPKPLPLNSFSILANVGGGAGSLVVQTNDVLVQQDLFSGATSERHVYLFGHLLSTKSIRYFVLLLIAAVSGVFAAAVMINRRRETNN